MKKILFALLIVYSSLSYCDDWLRSTSIDIGRGEQIGGTYINYCKYQVDNSQIFFTITVDTRNCPLYIFYNPFSKQWKT